MITPQKSSQKTNREPNLNLLGCSQFDLNLFREGMIKNPRWTIINWTNIIYII